MHHTTVAKIESGDREVKLDEAAAMADLFDLPLDSMMGRRQRHDEKMRLRTTCGSCATSHGRASPKCAGPRPTSANAVTDVMFDGIPVDIEEYGPSLKKTQIDACHQLDQADDHLDEVQQLAAQLLDVVQQNQGAAAVKRNRRAGVEDRWTKTVRDERRQHADGAQRQPRQGAALAGALCRRPEAASRPRRSTRKADAQAWLDTEVTAEAGHRHLRRTGGRAGDGRRRCTRRGRRHRPHRAQDRRDAARARGTAGWHRSGATWRWST